MIIRRFSEDDAEIISAMIIRTERTLAYIRARRLDAFLCC